MSLTRRPNGRSSLPVGNTGYGTLERNRSKSARPGASTPPTNKFGFKNPDNNKKGSVEQQPVTALAKRTSNDYKNKSRIASPCTVRSTANSVPRTKTDAKPTAGLPRGSRNSDMVLSQQTNHVDVGTTKQEKLVVKKAGTADCAATKKSEKFQRGHQIPTPETVVVMKTDKNNNARFSNGMSDEEIIQGRLDTTSEDRKQQSLQGKKQQQTTTSEEYLTIRASDFIGFCCELLEEDPDTIVPYRRAILNKQRVLNEMNKRALFTNTASSLSGEEIIAQMTPPPDKETEKLPGNGESEDESYVNGFRL